MYERLRVSRRIRKGLFPHPVICVWVSLEFKGMIKKMCIRRLSFAEEILSILPKTALLEELNAPFPVIPG